MPAQTRQFFLLDRPNILDGGSYMFETSNALTITSGAGVTGFALRWASSTHVLLLRGARLNAFVSTTVTGAQPVLGLSVARTYTSSDTGGSAITPSKKDSVHAASRITDMRAGDALTAGTRTLDTTFLRYGVGQNAIGAFILAERQPWGVKNDEPVVLRQNEGIVLTNLNATTAGVLQYQLALEWIEIPLSAW